MTEGQGSKPKSKDMRIKVTGCRHVYTGRNQRGDTYSIYEIDAERAADGVKINQKLRAFTALPIGQVIEVTVTPFISDRHGKSFTLEPKGRSGGSSTQRLNELTAEVEDLRNRVATLNQRVGALEGVLREKGLLAPPQQAPPAQADQAGLAERFGDDAPW
jgi:hypothetical protein